MSRKREREEGIRGKQMDICSVYCEGFTSLSLSKIIVYCPKLAYVEKERERRGDTGKEMDICSVYCSRI